MMDDAARHEREEKVAYATVSQLAVVSTALSVLTTQIGDVKREVGEMHLTLDGTVKGTTRVPGIVDVLGEMRYMIEEVRKDSHRMINELREDAKEMVAAAQKEARSIRGWMVGLGAPTGTAIAIDVIVQALHALKIIH